MNNEDNLKLIYKNAEKQQVLLNDKHLIVLALLQNFYQDFKLIPSTRALINYIKLKNPELQLDSILFAKLFHRGIAQACEIADLPRSPRCL